MTNRQQPFPFKNTPAILSELQRNNCQGNQKDIYKTVFDLKFLLFVAFVQIDSTVPSKAVGMTAAFSAIGFPGQTHTSFTYVK